MRSTFVVMAVLVLMIMSLTALGCWNRREIETLGFVTAIGIDKAEREGLTQFSVHIAKPSVLQSGTQGSAGAQRAFWLVTSTGHTLFEAIRNVDAQSPRRLFGPHNRWIIFGEEAARQGTREDLDFLLRDNDTRLTERVLVAKGARAVDFLQTEFELETLPAKGLSNLTKGAVQGLSTVVEVKLHDFLIALEEEGMESVAGEVEIIEKRPGDIKGMLVRKEVSRSPRLQGAAVFKGDRLVGWLDNRETRGLLWIKGKTQSGAIVIKHPGDEENIGLEMLRAKSRVSPRIQEDKVLIQIRVDAEAYLGDTQAFLDPLKYPGLVTDMERRMATVIGEEIESVLRRAQSLGSDIFGFGALVRRLMPGEWRKLRDRWDEEFRLLEFEIEVKTKIVRSGLILRSTRIK